MKLDIILPLHKFDEKISDFLKGAITSIVEQEKDYDSNLSLLIVLPEKIKVETEKFVKSLKTKLNINYIINDGKTDFQSQINFGVKASDAEYFSILEVDDQYSTTIFNVFEKHLKSYPEVKIFLPIIIEINDKEQALKLTNQLVWSKEFIGENNIIGYLNTKSLNDYTDFKISGGFFNREDFLNIGGLKSNIVLAFNYEFLLRALNNGYEIYNMPKIGYKHMTDREDSLFKKYAVDLSMKERKFWFNTAKNESHFNNDRQIDLSSLETISEEQLDKEYSKD